MWLSGDTNGNNQMETTETWTYTYVRAVTQAQIDSNGGGNGTLTDVATVNADSANGSVTDSDDASVPVCQEPALSIVKSASVPGDCGDVVGELITYAVVIDNIGNVALDSVVADRHLRGRRRASRSTAHRRRGVSCGEVFDHRRSADGIMGVTETWTYKYAQTVTQAESTATVTATARSTTSPRPTPTRSTPTRRPTRSATTRR